MKTEIMFDPSVSWKKSSQTLDFNQTVLETLVLTIGIGLFG